MSSETQINPIYRNVFYYAPPLSNNTNNTSMQYFGEQAKAAKYDKIKNVPDNDIRKDKLLEYHNELTRGGRKKSFRKTNRKRKSRRRTNRRRTNRRRTNRRR